MTTNPAQGTRMTRPHRTLALASLLSILLTLFGAGTASAEDRQPEHSPSVAARTPVVADDGADSPTQDNRASSLAATCYGGAVRWDAGYIDEPAGYEYNIPGPDDAEWPIYVTSARCRDVNMRLVHYPGPVTVRVCFFFPNNSVCDDPRTISGFGWHVISDGLLDQGVPDGAKYSVVFDTSIARQIGDVAD
jgi:hypothetical protein